MTENAKITLSAKELELVCNTDWILTRHAIIQKVYQLFGDAIPHLENTLAGERGHLPAKVFINQPKISRGENYQQLPYVMLDYPRDFSREDSFAIRTFFWWGNFFSVTLQLSGNYKNEYLSHLINQFTYLQQNGFWVCISSDPWEHHFDNSNYLQIQTLTKDFFWAILCREPFVKIAKKISLQRWQEVPVFITTTFDEMIQLLKEN
jgi:hypothetical protein